MDTKEKALAQKESSLVARERAVELRSQTMQLPESMANGTDASALTNLRKTVDDLTKAHQAERVKWGEQMDRLRSELAAAEGEALKVKLLEQELAAAKEQQQDEKRASLQVVRLQNALDVANALRTNASLIKLQTITVGPNAPASIAGV